MRHCHIDCGFGSFVDTKYRECALGQSAFHGTIWVACTSYFVASSTGGCSPRTASSAILALKSWGRFLRGLRLMIVPFLVNYVGPKNSAVIFYPPIQIPEPALFVDFESRDELLSGTSPQRKLVNQGIKNRITKITHNYSNISSVPFTA